ncbi:hypothetical protein KZZ52_03100 [Dactylosporangium sp. AC04546]|uniref:hypothetical protein n=1 Tax=Dactylosporangium sp. AC04546 TaxID=2862460 RepID=UPI001EDFA39F|nr:hypothetical protein [Dactylosporangium sp. AC04546]WVK84440.1 hypothetical protein KZZ52_03100 [Dactylosporangium sp. AC04546]
MGDEALRRARQVMSGWYAAYLVVGGVLAYAYLAPGELECYTDDFACRGFGYTLLWVVSVAGLAVGLVSLVVSWALIWPLVEWIPARAATAGTMAALAGPLVVVGGLVGFFLAH